MNVESLLPFLGTPLTSQDMHDAFSALGIDLLTEATLPEDEFSAYIERPSVLDPWSHHPPASAAASSKLTSLLSGRARSEGDSWEVAKGVTT